MRNQTDPQVQENLERQIKAIAFYLPQYHPIPENDDWWGKGFTEWTNVTKCQPRFKGHYQPHLPTELGFYDLRIPEVRQAQADLAREYGIFGFCYYHYWFEGRRLLHRPLDEVIASQKPDFPFCLCWANENWTRGWDGSEHKVLLEQKSSEEDARNHGRFLAGIFKDRRYIRVNGKPLFLIYRSDKIPNLSNLISILREEVFKILREDIFLCRVESFGKANDPSLIDFDAAVGFPVHDMISRKYCYQRGRFWDLLRKLKIADIAYKNNRIMDYKEASRDQIKKKYPDYIYFPSVVPRWDNSPRRKTDAAIFVNDHVEFYEQWLKDTVEKLQKSSQKEKFLFVIAWNEWGEGNYLEPDVKHGRAYLEATRRALL